MPHTPSTTPSIAGVPEAATSSSPIAYTFTDAADAMSIRKIKAESIFFIIINSLVFTDF
jgi:hypothetical protein